MQLCGDFEGIQGLVFLAIWHFRLQGGHISLIVPSMTCFSDMVTVFLAKSDEGKKWSHATAAAKAQADKKNAAMKPSDSSDMSKDPSAGNNTTH